MALALGNHQDIPSGAHPGILSSKPASITDQLSDFTAQKPQEIASGVPIPRLTQRSFSETTPPP